MIFEDEATEEAPAELPIPAWSSREEALIEPPRSVAVRVELTAEDVDGILRSVGSANKLSIPMAAVVVLYFGMKTLFGDAIPDVALYGILGLVFVVNALLSLRKTKDHYLSPGSLSVTLSADGVEISSESYGSYIPWAMIDLVTRVDGLYVLRTAEKPSFHAFPAAGLDETQIALIDAWIVHHRRTKPRRWGRLVFAVLAIIATLIGAVWLWDRLGRPMPPMP